MVAKVEAGSSLHVVVLAPPYVEVPPRTYGGTESVCAGLVDGLVARGHAVDLISVGPGDGTRGRFHATRAQPQKDRMGQIMPELLHVAQAAEVIDRLEPDIVHDHTLGGLLAARSRPAPTVATVHGPMEPEMVALATAVADDVHFVAISERQRETAADLPWAGVVHNAVQVEQFPFVAEKDDYALVLGRSTPEKGLPTAIAAGREAHVRVVLAAKCREPDEQEYFEKHVRPELGPGTSWLGEVGGRRKLDLLGRARCLLFPIDWEEPFGMVLVEALACGTPVVALSRGAVPEIIEHGVTGLVTDDVDELPGLLHDVTSIDPRACRHAAEERFGIDRMAAEYEAVYEEVLGR